MASDPPAAASPRHPVSAQARTTNLVLGTALSVAWAFVAMEKLRFGLLGELLWACHIASLGIGLGLLVGNRWLVAVGTLFHLAVGFPAYLVDALATTTTVASSVLHVASPIAGLIALRRNPWPKRTAWGALGLCLGLIAPCRWFTEPALNVNLVFAPYKPIGSLLPSSGVSWFVNALLLAIALFTVERGMRRWKSRGEAAGVARA